MLYVSTRNKTDSFTAYRALHEDRAPDGGLFVPFRIPAYSQEEIRQLKTKTFGENVAQVLNLFFSTGLTGWDVDVAVGRGMLRTTAMTHRILVAELWHNLESRYGYSERNLYCKLSGDPNGIPTDWSKIAIRIAMLFGVYGEISKLGVYKTDIAVPSGDLSVPMSAWYARRMGLPICNIICGCNENGAFWDLIHRGELNTAATVVATEYPELDHACPLSIERLIYSVFGHNEAIRFVETRKNGGIYTLDAESSGLISEGFFAAVVSGRRTRSVITASFRSNGYIMDGYAAVAYGSLQDYRACTGESTSTLLLADISPVHTDAKIASILGISPQELKKSL